MMSSSSSTKYRVEPLPTPLPSTWLDKYRELRLLALRTDPQFFGSNYIREAAFTEDIWRARITGDDRQLFIAATEAGDGDPTGSEWVATIGVLSPRALRSIGMSPPASLVNSTDNLYALGGMWTRPEHRRRGLAARLGDAALRWAKEDVGRHSGQKAVVLLRAEKINTPARRLYESLGFIVLPDDTGDSKGDLDGTLWMAKFSD